MPRNYRTLLTMAAGLHSALTVPSKSRLNATSCVAALDTFEGLRTRNRQVECTLCNAQEHKSPGVQVLQLQLAAALAQMDGFATWNPPDILSTQGHREPVMTDGTAAVVCCMCACFISGQAQMWGRGKSGITSFSGQGSRVSGSRDGAS